MSEILNLILDKAPIKEHAVNRVIETTSHSGLRVASCSLYELFSGSIFLSGEGTNIGKLTIPEYQRPYVWKEKQLNRLIRDLIAYKQETTDGKPLYYLGSIILHQDGDQLKIIDGQQRITTMLILQAVIWQHSALAQIAYRSPVSIHNIKKNHSYIQAVFNRDVAEFQNISLEDIIDFSQINVTLIITDSEDLAYTFFETQNTGGIRLSGTDIAKAHHLRAIPHKKMVAHQATTWERSDPSKVEACVKNLIRVRFWKHRNWEIFPFYREESRIKEVIIEEFTENTQHQAQDLSFYYSTVQNENGRAYQVNQSPYRQIRQPLYDGNNFMDYVHEYLELHHILFERNNDPRVSNAFYDFRKALLHGENGTLFLKELTEIALVTYVSRFGFDHLLEFSLWVYRYIYSIRVSFDRNVRENSISKFVFDNALVDTILEAYTFDELMTHLKKYRYSFSDKNLKEDQSKNKHIKSVKAYFSKLDINIFKSIVEMQPNNIFDKILITAINERLKKFDIND